MDGRVWNADWYSSTYEPGSYSTRTMTQVKNANGDVPPAILSQVANGNGSCYMLLAEANVYNDENLIVQLFFIQIREVLPIKFSLVNI